jgi:hypothetical protein
MAGKSNINMKTNNIEKDSTQELIAKAVAEALAKEKENLKLEIENELKNKSIELEKNNSKLNIKNRNFVPDDARIRIESNVSGEFMLVDAIGKTYRIKLNGYGYTATISFRELKNFHGNNHSFLNTGKLIITDVISNIDITLDDVIEDFDLQHIYHNEKIIRPFEIDYYLSDKVSIDEFNKKLENSNNLLETIIEVAVILFKKGQFTDNSKMNKLREITRMPELFTR